jgi:hypothetical protein
VQPTGDTARARPIYKRQHNASDGDSEHEHENEHVVYTHQTAASPDSAAAAAHDAAH